MLPAALRPLRRAIAAHAPVLDLHLQAWSFWWRRHEPEVRWLRSLCVPGEWSIDVGAHAGVYSHFMARWSAGVIAFEPNPESARRLRRALRDRAEVVEAALSDQAGEVELQVPLADGVEQVPYGSIEHAALAGFSGALHRFRVRRGPLAGFVATGRRIGFIKIDVEGHELQVVRGALDCLRTDRPTLLIEAEERHRSRAVEALRDVLEPLGYRGAFLWGSLWRPIEEFTPERYQVLPLGSGPYVFNFVFVARPDATRRLGLGDAPR